jgi:hypothetical protein
MPYPARDLHRLEALAGSREDVDRLVEGSVRRTFGGEEMATHAIEGRLTVWCSGCLDSFTDGGVVHPSRE